MDIGFYLLDVDAKNSVQAKILTAVNQLCEDRPYDNIIVFNNQFNRLDHRHKYYMLHIQQAKYFDGILFVFDTKSAMLTQTFPSPKKQIMFMSEPEWSINPALPYGFWYNIYMKPQIELLTDKKETHDIIDICWKKPIGLIPEINSKELQNVISKL
jgi:hypothetical protein